VTGIDKDQFDYADALSKIHHRMEESDKFRAEMAKLNAENLKLSAEERKLYAEGLKLQRDRWLAPIAVAATVGAVVAALVGHLLK
jgi:negative regulator of sigma E activity